MHLRFATLSVCAMGTTPLVALLALTAGVEGLAWLLGGIVTSIILSRTVCTVRTVRTTCSDGTSTALPKPRRRKRRSLNLAAAGRDLRHPPLHSRNDCARVRLRRCGHRLRAGAHARSRARCPCDMAAAAAPGAPGAPNLAAPSKFQKVRNPLLPATETVT